MRSWPPAVLGRFASSATVRLIEDEERRICCSSQMKKLPARISRASVFELSRDKSIIVSRPRWQCRSVRQPYRIGAAIRSISFPTARTSQSRHRIYAWHCAIPDRSTYSLECCRCCVRLEQASRSRCRKDGRYHCSNHTYFGQALRAGNCGCWRPFDRRVYGLTRSALRRKPDQSLGAKRPRRKGYWPNSPSAYHDSRCRRHHSRICSRRKCNRGHNPHSPTR